MVKQVSKGGETAVLMMENPVARVLGHMQRQRPIRPKQAKTQNTDIMQLTALARADLGQRRRRKGQRRLLPDAQ